MTKKTTTATTTTETKTTSKKTDAATAKTRKIKGKSLHELIGNDLNKLREKTEFVEIESRFETDCNRNVFFIKGFETDYYNSDLKDIMQTCFMYDLIPIVTKEIFEIWKNG